MGLDFTIGKMTEERYDALGEDGQAAFVAWRLARAPHWSYGGFNRFRNRVMRAIGEGELDAMKGFGGKRPWDEVDHPIKPLLDHSDCDGDLSPQDCATVAPALREVVEHWGEGDYDRQHGERLAEMMEAAVRADERLVFC